MTQFEKLDLLLRECGGTIQTFQVLNNGISKSVFYAYVKERGLEQASHGVCMYHLIRGQMRCSFCICVVVKLYFLTKLHCFFMI